MTPFRPCSSPRRRPRPAPRGSCIGEAALRLLTALALALVTLQPGLPLRAGPAQVMIQVQAGDTLETIARRHGTSLALLMRLNQLADPDRLQVGQWLKLPSGRAEAVARPPSPEAPAAPEAQAALLLSPAERRDRASLAQRELGGQVSWKWFGSTAVDWNGWRLHPGGVRITLVRPAAADVGVRRAGATALAVQCSSLRHTWRVDGAWEPWSTPAAGSVGLRIVLDLCSNTLDGPAVPVPPPPGG